MHNDIKCNQTALHAHTTLSVRSHAQNRIFALINDGNASDTIAVGCSPTVIPQCAVCIATEQFYDPTCTSTSIEAYSENAKFRKRPNLENPTRIQEARTYLEYQCACRHAECLGLFLEETLLSLVMGMTNRLIPVSPVKVICLTLNITPNSHWCLEKYVTIWTV